MQTSISQKVKAILDKTLQNTDLPSRFNQEQARTAIEKFRPIVDYIVDSLHSTLERKWQNPKIIAINNFLTELRERIYSAERKEYWQTEKGQAEKLNDLLDAARAKKRQMLHDLTMLEARVNILEYQRIEQNKKITEWFKDLFTPKPSEITSMTSEQAVAYAQSENAAQLLEKYLLLKELKRTEQAQAHLIIGGIYFRQQKVNEAIKAYEKSSTIMPEWSRPDFALGLLYRKMYAQSRSLVDLDKSNEHLRKANKKEPDADYRTETIQKIMNSVSVPKEYQSSSFINCAA